MTPGLPFVPAIAVMVNFYLILKLSVLTLVRFTVWMTLGEYDSSVQIRFRTHAGTLFAGLIMYFKYGIKNSTLEVQEEHAVELTVHSSPSESINRFKPTHFNTNR